MSYTLLETYIRQLMQSSPGPQLDVAWQRGEPMLRELDFFRQHNAFIIYPTCGNALVLEHNGNVYSCDHFVEPEYLLGNVRWNALKTLVTSEKQRRFARQSTPHCRSTAAISRAVRLLRKNHLRSRRNKRDTGVHQGHDGSAGKKAGSLKGPRHVECL